MHRVAIIALVAALAGAPCAGAAYQPKDLPAPAQDLRAQLMMRLFGEISDARASIDASYGDAVSESPLRGVALVRSLPHNDPRPFGPALQVIAYELRPAAAEVAPESTQSFGSGPLVDGAQPVAIPPADFGSLSTTASFSVPSAFTTGHYEPVAPRTAISPQPGSISFGPSLGGPAATTSASALSFGDRSAQTGSSNSSISVPAMVRVGPLNVATRFEGETVQSKQPSLLDSGYGAGADFSVRAGARNVNLNLSSGYERATSNGTTPYASNFSLGSALPADGVPVVPNYAELSRVSIGAAVSVPVLSRLTLDVNYGAGRLFGQYGLTGANFGGTDNTYGGKLTFEMPHSANTLSISAGALHYQDGLIPSNTLNQTREDVNFTVKF